MIKRLLAALAALVLVSAGMVIAAAPAQAVWQCYTWSSSDGRTGNARCDFGLGGVYVVEYCWNGVSDQGPYYGPTVPAGQTSSRTCPFGTVLDGMWYETF